MKYDHPRCPCFVESLYLFGSIWGEKNDTILNNIIQMGKRHVFIIIGDHLFGIYQSGGCRIRCLAQLSR